MHKTIETVYNKIKNLTSYINFKIILTAQILLLVIGISFGLTGSSIGCMRDFGNFFSYDLHGFTGKCQGIRSDEWAVDTPLAISQFNNHNEQFPVTNKNFGIEGKQMSIVHDTGTPVAELSLLAKPATWGFFLFDLRTDGSQLCPESLPCVFLSFGRMVILASIPDWLRSFGDIFFHTFVSK